MCGKLQNMLTSLTRREHATRSTEIKHAGTASMLWSDLVLCGQGCLALWPLADQVESHIDELPAFGLAATDGKRVLADLKQSGRFVAERYGLIRSYVPSNSRDSAPIEVHDGIFVVMNAQSEFGAFRPIFHVKSSPQPDRGGVPVGTDFRPGVPSVPNPPSPDDHDESSNPGSVQPCGGSVVVKRQVSGCHSLVGTNVVTSGGES